MTLDYILHGGYVITMEGRGTGIIEKGAVGVRGNRIEAVGTEEEILGRYKAHRYINTAHKAVMPGFVDAHIHTSNAIVRGGSQDIPSDQWMFRGILPLLSLAKKEDLVTGSMLNILEAVKAGTTTFGDFDVPMLDLVENHVKVKTRAVVSNMINELPQDAMKVTRGEPYPLDHSIGNEKLRENTELIDRYHNSENGRILCRYGPQAADMCSVELLKEIRDLARKKGVDLYLHVAQSEEEIRQTVQRTGKRPIPLLEELGYLYPGLLAAHMTYADAGELQTVAASGVSMALCSNSIDIIGGVLPPALEFASFGGRVALGTDQAPGNNCNNMFNEMKISSLLAKYKSGDATTYPAFSMLRMATIESAKALGIGDRVGSLKVGKQADLIVIDLSEPHMNPIYEYPVRTLIPNLVYSARGHEVEFVMIDGNLIVEEHKVLTVDEEAVIRQANAAARRIEQDLAKKDWSKNLPLARWTAEENY